MEFKDSGRMKRIIAAGVLLLLLAVSISAQVDPRVACGAQVRMFLALCVIFRIIQAFAALVAAIALVFAGLKWSMSEDIPEISEAKTIAAGAIIGLLIVIIAFQLIVAIVSHGEAGVISLECPKITDDVFGKASAVADTIRNSFCVIFRSIEALAAVIASVILVYAGIEWMTFERPWIASDEPDLRAKAKGRATHAIVGLLIVIVVVELISNISVGITGVECGDIAAISSQIKDALCFILSAMVGFAGVIAAIILAYSGVEWVISESDEIRANAKGRAMYAITGLLVVVMVIQLMVAILTEAGVGETEMYRCSLVDAAKVSEPIAKALCVILRVIQALAGVIAGIIIAFSAIEWITSESPERIDAARSRAIKAILGLIVVILSLNLIVAMMEAGGFLTFDCEGIFDYASCVREECGLEVAHVTPPGPGPLIAGITSPPDGSTHVVGTPVEFRDPPSGGTPLYSWLWDFGDGETSPKENVNHTYTEPIDPCTVWLTVKDSDTPKNEVKKSITLHIVEEAPPVVAIEASITSPDDNSVYGVPPQELTFEGEGSGGSGTLEYSWKIEKLNPTTSTIHDSGFSDLDGGITPLTYTFNERGNYRITLTVREKENPDNKAEASITISICGNEDPRSRVGPLPDRIGKYFMDGHGKAFSGCSTDQGCREDWTCVADDPRIERIDRATDDGSFCMADSVCCWEWEHQLAFDCPPPTEADKEDCQRPTWDDPNNVKDCWCVKPGDPAISDPDCKAD